MSDSFYEWLNTGSGDMIEANTSRAGSRNQERKEFPIKSCIRNCENTLLDIIFRAQSVQDLKGILVHMDRFGSEKILLDLMKLLPERYKIPNSTNDLNTCSRMFLSFLSSCPMPILPGHTQAENF